MNLQNRKTHREQAYGWNWGRTGEERVREFATDM